MGLLDGLLGAFRNKAVPDIAANAVLVDVRTESEFNAGHIAGALSIPLNRIHLEIAQAVPDRATPLLLYCRSGARSGSACTILHKMGYEQVANGGGMDGLSLSLHRTARAHGHGRPER